MRLQGKTALVTGGASGIGAACAETFAREGARVMVVDFNSEGAERVAQAIRESGGQAFAHAADLGDRTAIDRMIATALESFGQLDILHNNTAYVPRGPLAEVSPEEFQRTFDVSLAAYWYASKLALPHMTARNQGVILNTASISGLAADHGLGGYNVMKAGVLNLTRSIAIDYARQGIRCNALCPGIIFTDPYEQLRERAQERFDTMANAVPMGRFGTAQEVANLALFLVSDEASYITGANMVVDGGRMAHTGQPSPIGYAPY